MNSTDTLKGQHVRVIVFRISVLGLVGILWTMKDV